MKLPTETLEVDQGVPQPGELPGLAGAAASRRSPQCAGALGRCEAASGAQSTGKRRATAYLEKMSLEQADLTRATHCAPVMTRGGERPGEAAGTGMWGSVLNDGISREVFWSRHNTSCQSPKSFCSPEMTLLSCGFDDRAAAAATSNILWSDASKMAD